MQQCFMGEASLLMWRKQQDDCVSCFWFSNCQCQTFTRLWSCWSFQLNGHTEKWKDSNQGLPVLTLQSLCVCVGIWFEYSFCALHIAFCCQVYHRFSNLCLRTESLESMNGDAAERSGHDEKNNHPQDQGLKPCSSKTAKISSRV